MQHRKKLLSRLDVLLLVAVSAVAVFYAYRTFSTTGHDAVALMNGEERSALVRLSSIDPQMSKDEVYETLGPPTDDFYLMARWNGFGGSPLSQVRVYFTDRHPRKIRWMKLGFFVYERHL